MYYTSCPFKDGKINASVSKADADLFVMGVFLLKVGKIASGS